VHKVSAQADTNCYHLAGYHLARWIETTCCCCLNSRLRHHCHMNSERHNAGSLIRETGSRSSSTSEMYVGMRRTSSSASEKYVCVCIIVLRLWPLMSVYVFCLTRLSHVRSDDSINSATRRSTAGTESLLPQNSVPLLLRLSLLFFLHRTT